MLEQSSGRGTCLSDAYVDELGGLHASFVAFTGDGDDLMLLVGGRPRTTSCY